MALIKFLIEVCVMYGFLKVLPSFANALVESFKQMAKLVIDVLRKILRLDKPDQKEKEEVKDNDIPAKEFDYKAYCDNMSKGETFTL